MRYFVLPIDALYNRDHLSLLRLNSCLVTASTEEEAAERSGQGGPLYIASVEDAPIYEVKVKTAREVRRVR